MIRWAVSAGLFLAACVGCERSCVDAESAEYAAKNCETEVCFRHYIKKFEALEIECRSARAARRRD